MANSLEEILQYHGNPGKYQLVLWALIMFCLFHVGMIQQFNVMISYTPNHHCTPPSNWSSLYNDSMLYPDMCNIYVDPLNHSAGQKPCEHGYDYVTLNDEIYPSNEFNLVCDKFHWVENTLAITFIGVLFGGIVFGPLSDRLGRKRVMSFILVCLSVLNTSIYFAPNFESFIVIRCVLGFLTQGLQTTCLTYISELFLATMRTVTTASVGIMWATILPIFAGLFYFLRDWRVIHLIMGSLSCISAIYIWFLPESVSWLVSKWRLEEAAKILNKFARFNGIKPSETLNDDLQDLARSIQKLNLESSNSHKTRWTQLFTSPAVRRIMISLLYIWFTTACIVYGLSFSISSLKGNSIYINYVITGCLEVIIRLSVMMLFVRYGRRTIICPVLILCGILTIGGFMIWHYTPKEYVAVHKVATIIALAGRNLIAVNFTMLVVLTSELIPVSLRSSGVGFGFSAARFGNILTPYTRFLKTIWVPLPQLFYAILAIGGGFVVMSLPETFNKQLPNTIEDVEELVKRKKTTEDRNRDDIKENADKEHLQSLMYQPQKGFIKVTNKN